MTSTQSLELFGEYAFDPVDRDATLVIIGTHCTDSPFRVASRGLGLYINDVLAYHVPWPGAEYVADKPAVPAGVTRDSTPNDVVQGKLLKDFLVNAMVVNFERHGCSSIRILCVRASPSLERSVPPQSDCPHRVC